MANNKQASFIEDNLLNIKRFFSGCVETADGRYLTAVEVLPINFKFKTDTEKILILLNFQKYLRIAPVKMTIKTISRRTNINRIIERSDKAFNNYPVHTPATEGLHNDEVILINRLANRQGVERNFFIIFEYTPTENFTAKDEEDIIYFLNSAKSTAKQYLYACGNAVITHADEDLFMMELCYRILNKNKSIQSMYDTWNEIVDKASEYYDYDEEKIESLEIPYTNIISPKEIKMFSSYCVIDGVYYAFLFIPSTGYPGGIAPAWLSGLINSGEGIDVDIFINRQNTNKIRNDLRRRVRVNRVRRNHMDNNGANYEEVMSSLNASDYIKEKLAEGNSLYYINTMITISGDSFDEMNFKYNAIKEMMDSNDIELTEFMYNVDKALKCYLPLNQIDKNIFEKTKRNIPTCDLSAFYPFTSFEISDDNGIVMGVNKDNNSLVILDLFNSKKYKNANLAILGTSGAGKTFTLGITLKRMAMQGIRTFLIAPLKGHEYYSICRSAGGQVIKISTGSQNCINIMEIRPKDNDTSELLGFEDEDDIILSKKVSSLLNFFSLIITDMSLAERELLDKAILETYNKMGINKDNDSLIDTLKTHLEGKTVYKRMPILEDLYNVLRENPKTERLADILDRYVHGSASSFNGQTNVNLDSPFTVLDISALDEDLVPIGMYLALDFVWDKAKQDVTEKKVIAIDETWKLIKENERAAKFVLEIFKIIRGYGGSAIAASQDIGDFFALKGGEYGKAIISNSKTKIILNLETEEAETVQKILNLSNKERNDIESFDRGNMLVTSNNNTFTLAFTASEIETLMITTDPVLNEKKKVDRRFSAGIFVGNIQKENAA